MQCRQCEYPLWNLTARACPECGAPFAASDYEFVPGSVQFRCPHCEQAYYGTTAKGHLDPPAFDCVGCGRHVHMDEMVLLPAEGVHEDQTRVDANPWLDRKNQGRLVGWLKTLGRGMIFPSPLIKATPIGSSTGQAWLFCTLSITAYYTAGIVLGAIIFGAFFAIMSGSFGGPGGGGPPPAQMFGSMMGVCAGSFLIILLATLVLVGLWGLVTHGILRMAGGEPVGGIGRTYQALCYSCGPNFFAVIPCINQYLMWAGWVWWVICAIFMVKDGQRVSGGRATVAVLTVPTAVFLTLVGLIIWWVIAMQTMMNTAAATVGANSLTAGSETSLVASAVWDYAAANNGQGPVHAVQLLNNGNLSTIDMVVAHSVTFEEDVPLGNSNMEKFGAMTAAEQQAVVQAVLAAQPSDVTAHRLGDFVFVHHGLDFNNIDGRLWTVIMSPDPDAGNNPPQPHEELVVGTMDGGFTTLTAANFKVKLAEQNALRRQLGLPQIPEPRTVTHDSPARASDAADGDAGGTDGDAP